MPKIPLCQYCDEPVFTHGLKEQEFVEWEDGDGLAVAHLVCYEGDREGQEKEAKAS